MKLFLATYFLFLSVEGIISDLASCNSTLTGSIHEESECTAHSDEIYFCCYLTQKDYIYPTASQMCLPQKITNYTGTKTITYNNIEYMIECGDAPLVNECGANPSSVKDCTALSTKTNSCCFYAYGGLKGCYWYGSAYQGSAFRGGLTLECTVAESWKLKLSLVTWIIMILVIYI